VKQIAVISTVLFLAFMQSGCGTQIGISGQAREDYLKSIKPRLQYYEKPGWTSETRRQDAAECGASGDSSDHAGIGSTRIKAAQLPGETEGQTEMRLRQAWHACMKEKGYRDTRAVPR
jgi:hypothetical protein